MSLFRRDKQLHPHTLWIPLWEYFANEKDYHSYDAPIIKKEVEKSRLFKDIAEWMYANDMNGHVCVFFGNVAFGVWRNGALYHLHIPEGCDTVDGFVLRNNNILYPSK